MDFQIDSEDEDWPHYLLECLPTEILFEIFRHLTWQDLCSVCQTCTKFKDLCDKATLWCQIRTIDFRLCNIPMAEKMLNILEKCPNTEEILVAGIITDSPSMEQGDLGLVESIDSNTVGFDHFILDILRQCSKLQTISISNPEMTNMSVDAICAKSTHVKNIHIENTPFITNDAVIDLVSVPTLSKLSIKSCENLLAPNIRHRDGENIKLNLTHLSLDRVVTSDCLRSIIINCCQLKVLDLSESFGCSSFSFEDLPMRNALNSLQILILRSCIEMEVIELSHCPELNTVDITQCYRLVSLKAAAPKLQNLETSFAQNLKTLQLYLCDIATLELDLPNLEEWHVNSSNLHSLKLIQCSSMTCNSLMAALPHRNALTSLYIQYCRKLTQEDIEEVILKQFSMLEDLTLLHEMLSEGINAVHRPWNNIKLASPNITHLQFGHCKNSTCLLLRLPKLTKLEMRNCRDITEGEFVDGLLYGKQITRMMGIDGLIKERKMNEVPFIDEMGVPNIHTLSLYQMSGIQGQVLSQSLGHCEKLAVLKIEKCAFVAQLDVKNWPSLETLQIKSCGRLKQLTMSGVTRLSQLEVMWCSMVQTFEVHADGLNTVDVTGTNFVNFTLDSKRISQLNVNGVCTQADHRLKIRCPNLVSLTLQKCDMLTDEIVCNILSYSPSLSTVNIAACSKTRTLTIPKSVTVYSLQAHRSLREIIIERPVSVQHLTLNNLPKFDAGIRYHLLKQCERSLQVLDMRAIPGEKEVSLDLENLTSLTLDQGIHLAHLEIFCPKLTYLRIQGCPRLATLVLQINKLSQLQVSHSSPLLALHKMSLHIHRIRHLSRVLLMYCPNLEELHLYRCHISQEEVKDLGKAMPNLRKIYLNHCVTERNIRFPYSISSNALGRNQAVDLDILADLI